MYQDILLIQKRTADGNIVPAALVTDSDGVQAWHNGGTVAKESIDVPSIGLNFSWSAAGVKKYMEAKAAGDETAHHTVVGKARVGDTEYVAFPTKDGQRLGLKPSGGGDVVGFFS